MPLSVRKACVRMLLVALVPLSCAGPTRAADSPSDERAALVNVIDRCSRATVDMRGLVYDPRGFYEVGAGSGTIVHENGYIITANHVAKGPPSTAHLYDGRTYEYRILMRIADDVGLVKIDPPKPLEAMKIGRSNNLMLGEPAIVIGNANALTHTVSTGLVSGLDRGPQHGANVHGAIQTSAPVNPGNSGGPLINADGEFIGMIQSVEERAENVAFAVPVDHIRRICIENLYQPQRDGYWLGMEVDGYGQPVVTKVTPGSPADKAGVEVGDLLTHAADMRITDGLHFCIAMMGRKPGQEFPIEIRRETEAIKLNTVLEEIPYRPADDVEGLVNGLDYRVYEGNWTLLPEFDKLTPVESGRTDKFSHTTGSKYGKGGDYYGLVFAGYIDVPADGAYFFYLVSDDGSRLWIGDELVVTNDGLHAPIEVAGSIRLKAGKHPVRVTFFEQAANETLTVRYSGPNIEKQEIPPAALFVAP